MIPQKPAEVCLADEGGQELDLILWEDIKGEENAGEFRLATDGELGRTVSRGVQTEPMRDYEEVSGILKDFPNLQLGGGLLPDPSLAGTKGREFDPLEWTVVIYPRSHPGGGK